jgi:carboxyl-terminal processing protease
MGKDAEMESRDCAAMGNAPKRRWALLWGFVCILSLPWTELHAEHGPSAFWMKEFDELLGKPQVLVSALQNYPWKDSIPASLPGFQPIEPQATLRVASIECAIKDYSARRHWESSDGDIWIDLVTFNQARDAFKLIRDANQSHAGLEGTRERLFFSNSGDISKEAIGAVFIASNGSVLNVGIKLPVHMDLKTTSIAKGDELKFDAALQRFQATLDLLTRDILDPAYVDFNPDVVAKPATLTMLRVAGFTRLWSAIKYNFVFLEERKDLDWDAVFDTYLPKIASAKDDYEYGRLLERAVALLKDGHTNVAPMSFEPKDSPALVLEPIEGKPVATVVGSLPELAAVTPGMELLEIDGRPVAEIIDRDIDLYLSVSTLQSRQLIESKSVLEGAPQTNIQTKWLGLDGKVTDIALTRNQSRHPGAVKRQSHALFEYRQLPGNVAYIGLNGFNSPGIVTEFESRFGELRKAKSWIIDLRSNGGGSDEFGFRILSRFIMSPVKSSAWRTREYKPAYAAWGKAQTWYEGSPEEIMPAEGPKFDGPVYVLTSPITCSAAEDFLIPLKMAKRITIVGEPTCGSSGQPLEITIYGAYARICTKWDRFPDGTEFVGIGILPDVPAARTKQDVASGRDAVLQKAIELVSKH